MPGKADTHVLGSRDGYRSLATSSGVTAAELSELETLGFGQTSDQDFVQSLDRQPSAFCRVLSSDRVALTRCFAGFPDDAGRATLELRTIVLTANQYAELCVSGLDDLVGDSGRWSDGAFSAGRQIELGGHARSAQRPITHRDLALLDAWLLAAGNPGTFVAMPEHPESHRAMFSFLQVIHPKDRLRFQWGVRLLSSGLGIHVGTIAPGGSRGGRRRIVDLDPKQGPRSPAVRYLAESLREGSLSELPTVAALTVGGKQGGSAVKSEVTAPRSRSRKNGIWIGSVALLLLAGGIGAVVLLQSGANDEPEQQPVASAAGENEHGQIASGLYDQIDGILTSAEDESGLRLVEILSQNRGDLLSRGFSELRRKSDSDARRSDQLEKRLAGLFDSLREDLEGSSPDLREEIRSELLPLLRNWQSAGSVNASSSASQLLEAVERKPTDEPSGDDAPSSPSDVEQPNPDADQTDPEPPSRFIDRTVTPEPDNDEQQLDEEAEEGVEIQVEPVADDPFERIASGINVTIEPTIQELSRYGEALDAALGHIEARSEDNDQEEQAPLLSVQQVQTLCVEWWACVTRHRQSVANLETETGRNTLSAQNIEILWRRMLELENSRQTLLRVHEILSDDRLTESKYFQRDDEGKDDEGKWVAWSFEKDEIEKAVLNRLKSIDASARKPAWTPETLSDFNENNADHLYERILKKIRKRLEQFMDQSQEGP
jgi:hypothetical protein